MTIYLAENEEYSWLLNSSPHSVKYRPIRAGAKKRYQTAEHLFESLKFEVYRPRIAQEVQIQSSRTKLHETVDKFEDDIRPNWLSVRIKMMEITLFRKFKKHFHLRSKLQSTGDRRIINNIIDPFWGVGADFQGQNQFGEALMLVRKSLRTSSFNLDAPLLLPSLPEPIKFSNCDCKCRVHGFSAFSQHPITFLDVEYPTAGHLFQAFRFSDCQKLVNRILRSTTAQVSLIAKAKKDYCRRDWKDIRIPAMRYIIWLKFTQHLVLLPQLLHTTDHELIEDSTDDDVLWGWGKGVGGTGQLAKALMRLRRKVLTEPLALALPPTVPPNPPRIREEVDDCCVVL